MPAFSGYPWAVGNFASCDAQGFIVQYSSAGFLYMCALQFMYVLVIKYGWKERDVKKLEKWFHIIPNAFGLATATAALALKQYNPANWDCWIAPLPADCTSSNEIRKGNTDLQETDCIRGDNANIFRWAFFFAPLWASILFCMVAMAIVHRTTKKAEVNFSKKYNKFSMRASSAGEPQISDEVKKQSIRYSLAFFTVWTFPTLARIIQFFSDVHPVIVVISGTTIGLQGLFNAFIYFRPRYNQCVKYDTWYGKVWALMCSTLFFCCYDVDYTKDRIDIDYEGSNKKSRLCSATERRGSLQSSMASAVENPGENDEEKRVEGNDEGTGSDTVNATTRMTEIESQE